MRAQYRLHGKVVRFGTMGRVNECDILTDLVHLENTMRDLGWPVTLGACVEAARASLRSS